MSIPVRERLLTLSRSALRLVAARWYLRGFAQSGRGFHGESMNLTKTNIRTLLLIEFDRIWDRDQAAKRVKR